MPPRASRARKKPSLATTWVRQRVNGNASQSAVHKKLWCALGIFLPARPASAQQGEKKRNPRGGPGSGALPWGSKVWKYGASKLNLPTYYEQNQQTKDDLVKNSSLPHQDNNSNNQQTISLYFTRCVRRKFPHKQSRTRSE